MNDVKFTINVKFPTGRRGDLSKMLRVKAFETELPLISHHLKDMKGIHFDSIMLSSRHVPMHSDVSPKNLYLQALANQPPVVLER